MGYHPCRDLAAASESLPLLPVISLHPRSWEEVGKIVSYAASSAPAEVWAGLYLAGVEVGSRILYRIRRRHICRVISGFLSLYCSGLLRHSHRQLSAWAH